jgi:type II secretory pathway component GspD/PulD (secretin)
MVYRINTATLPLPRFRLRQLGFRTVTVNNGQTLVLGGSEEADTDRIPVFGGDRPQIGRLFSRPEQEKELILFITPTVIDPAGNPVPQQSR